jgi:hypothetical protein
MRSLICFAASALLSFGTLAFLPGCTPDRSSNVPGSALLGAMGNGMVTYTAPSDGMIYIDDVDTHKIVYQGSVLRGDSITVDTDHNQVTISGRVVTQDTLNTGNRHCIYFLSSTS